MTDSQSPSHQTQEGLLTDPSSVPKPPVRQPDFCPILPPEDGEPEEMVPSPPAFTLPWTHLRIRFLYRGREAGCLTVTNLQGCRLYSGPLRPTPELAHLFGPPSLQQVQFPSAAHICNQLQRMYTQRLLDATDRGLILETQGQDLYAVRLCQSRVFWSGPGAPVRSPPNPMERERRIKVFSFSDFLRDLFLFQHGEAKTPPRSEIFFCFGEDWPDKKPKEKKLIMVEVVPALADALSRVFWGELSLPVRRVCLQDHDPHLEDETLEQFRELRSLHRQTHGL